MNFPKISASREKKLPFLLRLWRKIPTHRNSEAEGGAGESSDQEENSSTFDAGRTGQLESGITHSSDIAGELPGGVLKHLFKQPEWSALDGLNEYDEDYTSFMPRGAILTQDMIREVLRAGNQIVDETEQNVPRLSANGEALRRLESEREGDEKDSIR